ncbi:hypothetical protein ACFQ4K_34180 [Tistrella bauzanensis]
MTILLDVKGLQAFYGGTQALFGIDLAVMAGGITTIIGANGAGKTTHCGRSAGRSGPRETLF